MSIRVIQNEERATLQLDGAFGIEFASEFKQRLCELFSSRRAFGLSIAGITELDITAVQLIHAAKIRAFATGTNFELIDELPESVALPLRDAGIDVKFLMNDKQAACTTPQKVS